MSGNGLDIAVNNVGRTPHPAPMGELDIGATSSGSPRRSSYTTGQVLTVDGGKRA